ncbi:MAG: hypothetical protein ABI193_12010, partial [Minicystis sp.]
MTSFNHEDIIRLFDAACTAGIVDIRDALMAGIDPAFVGTFPKSKTSASQLLMDLDRLNAAGELLDGSVPFAIWLNNADRLAGNRNEAQVFREYRDLIQGGGGTTSSERRLESVRNRRSPTLPPPSLVDRLSSWALSGFSLVVMALIAGIAVAKGKSWQVARAWGDYVQLVFVIVVFIATCVAVPRAPEGTGANASRCQSCIKQFTNNWQLLWLLWVVFYAIHSMRHLVQQLLWRAEAP